MNSKSIKADRRLHSRKGMTLVEVLVAMTLLTLIVLVFTPLFMNYYRNVRTAGELTQKTYERTSLMERLVANPYKNDTGYETHVTKGNLPLTLTAGSTTVDFSDDIEGQLISESLNDGGSYVSFYSPNTSDTMVCFPASLTDDFLTKDITVVPKGFEFAAAAENKNSTGEHFEVYNTSSTGSRVKVNPSYYDIRYDSDGEGVAIFTFKGGNNVISFENSPLYIQYYTAASSMYKEVKVEITAPEIILVGEEASDDNYYYYATAGVDLKTGKMDIVAKQMNKDNEGNDVGLVSSMNDVEWVAKGRGDDGNGGVNQYGYYVMGGDAGQVRRFWRNETTGNYYWGGDVLGQYDRYYNITGNNSTGYGSHEDIVQTKSTQAQFKSIFHSNLGYYNYNGVTGANQLTADELITIGFEYRMITSNYYTANVTYSSNYPYYTTLGRVLAYKTNKKTAVFAGNGSDIDNGTGVFGGQASWRQSTNTLLRTLMPADNTYSRMNVDGYIEATNYEYQTSKGAKIDDKSLITITSVGAVQINKSNPKYSESTQSSVLGVSQLYPTQSYTLYCGYIPAVIDTWGWKTKHVLSTYNNYSMWLHTGTLGVATDGNYWYPVGKFADTKTSTSNNDNAVGDLSKDVFGTNTSWSSLLNYGSSASLYPYTDTSSTITLETISNQYLHHDAIPEERMHCGLYTHRIKIAVNYNYEYKDGCSNKTGDDTVEIVLELTTYHADDGYNDWTASLNSAIENEVKAACASKGLSFKKMWNNKNEWINNARVSTFLIWSKCYDENGNELFDDTEDYFYTASSSLPGSGQAGSATYGHLFITKSSEWKSDEAKYRGEIVTQEYVAPWDEPLPESQWQHSYETTSGYIRYYGPTSEGTGFSTKPSDVTNATLTKRSFLGTALPEEGNDYYISSGHEVDITMGYLSQPYAIDVNNPTVPKMSGLSGLTGGSDFYFKKPGDGIGSSILSGGAFNHSFVSGGLRDNVTMLDVKSFHDDLTGNNISLAGGYTLSYVANDYSYLTRLGQVLNNGVVYIRATGNGTESDTEGDLASGKGWSLAKETNVFHQFFGIDQYRGVSIGGGVGTDAILGWTTTYHKGYLNMSTDSNKAPQPSYSPSFTEGNQNYGVNYHPLMDTEVTTVNWGLTSDYKPQAMWGTSNGTLMSWYYNYENVSDSKIYSVCKEFENYSWCDKLGLRPTTATYKQIYYDYTTVSRNIYSDYGFVSVLKSINDICFCDDVWVAVGDQSGKKPSDYSAAKSYNYLGATGEAGSYVNVKFLDSDLKGSDGLPIARWIHVKIANETNVNIRSVVNCQGVWYLMGYIDANGNGYNDAGERCVMYFSTNPATGFLRCKTRKDLAGSYTGTGYSEDTYALYFDSEGALKQLKLEGVNKMACQSS